MRHGRWLDERKDLIDGVVITGGEPTIQSGLPEFIERIRAKGYRVKLDTNGSRPAVLAGLLELGLLDYVAMDIKAPMGQYDAFTGVHVEHEAINESIDRLLNGNIDYEFRTTVTPQLTHADILSIARRIQGAKRYVLQQYRRPADACDPRIESIPHLKTWPAEIAACAASKCRWNEKSSSHNAAALLRDYNQVLSAT
ncbi:MAG: anaerobic ribonucleoside-triphosphate reductase activating protein [Candidatus Hydrogenedentes bacterium]|nr:anaerobic ribonucleoside-triphosphate reductase activating protein [Candidatus Hydrogenedentota bacterium]